MTDQEIKFIKYKKQCLYIVNKITRLQLAGETPSEKLLKQAQEIQQAAEIPERFLKSKLR
jgi:hypothetical protein